MSFDKFTATLHRQWLIIVLALVAGFLAFIILLPLAKSYSATATVLVSQSSQQNTATLDPTKDPTTSGIDAIDLATLLTDGTIMQRVAADLHLSGVAIDKLPRQVRAKVAVGSGILPITFTDRNPDVAVAGANASASELARFDGEIKTSRYDRLLVDIGRQIEEVRAKIAIADAKISRLSNGDAFLVDVQGRVGIDSRIVALEQQRDNLQAALQGDSATAQRAAERPALSRDLAAAEIVKLDPMVAEIKQQYGKDLASKNVMQAGYTEQFPGLMAATQLASREGRVVDHEIDTITANPKKSETYVATLLDANKARGTVAQDAAELGAVRAELSTAELTLKDSSLDATRLSGLRTERAALEDSYRELVQSRGRTQADRAQAGSIDTVVVVDRASEAQQSMLSRPLVLGVATLVIALWLGLSLAFFLNSNDRRLQDSESIETLYGKPVFSPVG